MNILPQALSSVGHDHAQTVLIEAIKARADDKTALVSLIPALSNVPVATPEAEEALWDLALRSDDHEISSMARLALGSQAQRIAVADSERANRIVQRFLEELRSTRSDETTELILLALGNAGQALSVTAISRYAADSSAHLRAVAMHSLRFVKSSEAEAILINALKSDPESLVRVAAVEAFEYRELTAASFAAQEAALSRDTTVALRLKVLENLWRAHDRSPQVVALVRRVASVDPNRQVRTTAAGLMKDYDSSRLR